jgi:hypothetical protein
MGVGVGGEGGRWEALYSTIFLVHHAIYEKLRNKNKPTKRKKTKQKQQY